MTSSWGAHWSTLGSCNWISLSWALDLLRNTHEQHTRTTVKGRRRGTCTMTQVLTHREPIVEKRASFARYGRLQVLTVSLESRRNRATKIDLSFERVGFKSSTVYMSSSQRGNICSTGLQYNSQSTRTLSPALYRDTCQRSQILKVHAPFRMFSECPPYVWRADRRYRATKIRPLFWNRENTNTSPRRYIVIHVVLGEACEDLNTTQSTMKILRVKAHAPFRLFSECPPYLGWADDVERRRYNFLRFERVESVGANFREHTTIDAERGGKL